MKRVCMKTLISVTSSCTLVSLRRPFSRKSELMLICLVLLVPVLFTGAVSAPEHSPQGQADSRNISLDVVVTPKSGPPVSGLQQQDFTVLDNKLPQTITSFQAVDGRQAPIEIVLVIDAINTDFLRVAYERDQIDKFLRAEGGHLAHPFAFAVVTDTGMKIQEDFSIDGNSLSSALDQFVVGLRSIRRNAGFYGAVERYQISLEGLHQLLAREAPRPGRKIVIWFSPGWPLLSGPGVEELDAKQRQQLFAMIVSFSTQFLQSGVTLYSIDPLGSAEAGGFRPVYWKNFVKGVSKLSEVQGGDLGLEVLATQSGGIALNSSNDLTALLQKCITDLGAYYEISFNSPAGDQRDEFHTLEVRLTKPGLTVRTRQGYYSQP
jgi:VWFA-related protein